MVKLNASWVRFVEAWVYCRSMGEDNPRDGAGYLIILSMMGFIMIVLLLSLLESFLVSVDFPFIVLDSL